MGFPKGSAHVPHQLVPNRAVLQEVHCPQQHCLEAGSQLDPRHASDLRFQEVLRAYRRRVSRVDLRAIMTWLSAELRASVQQLQQEADRGRSQDCWGAQGADELAQRRDGGGGEPLRKRVRMGPAQQEQEEAEKDGVQHRSIHVPLSVLVDRAVACQAEKLGGMEVRKAQGA